MGDSWQNSVVLITSRDTDNSVYGTGFVVHRDEQGTYVLTCTHVVDDVGGKESVKVNDILATVIASSPADGIDITVLRVVGLADKPLLRPCVNDTMSEAFELAGYYHLDDNPKEKLVFRRFRGKFNEVIQAGMTLHTLVPVWDIEVTGKDELRPGNSGSPVVDEHNYAIGIVNTRLNADKKRGWVTPIKSLEEIWQGMPPDLFVQRADGKILEQTEKISRANQDEAFLTVYQDTVQVIHTQFGQKFPSTIPISVQAGNEPGEAKQVLLAREELLPIESSKAGSSSRHSPRRFVVLILLALLLLSGGSLIYRTALGHFPWQASPGLSTFISSVHTPQPNTSALGQSWHSGNLDNSDDLASVAWSGSRFVAVGGSCRLFFFFCSGTILTSPDGITWTPQNSTTSQHLYSVAWSGSRFVIVGDSGTVLTSSDGITWTSQNSGITGNLSGVAWSGSRFVAVGGSCRLFSFFCSDTIFTSPDGITWTSQHTPTNQHLHRVTWSGSLLVAVGNKGTIFTSPDGVTWTSQNSGTSVDLLGVVWSGSRFVTVGNSGTILTSPDGVTWTPQHPPTTKNLDNIVWSGSRLVIVGSSGTILTSPDGVTWTSRSSGTSQDLDDIVWSGSRFVTVGISGVISTSP